MLALQAPRADRVIFEYDEMAAPTAPSPGPGALRTPGDLADPGEGPAGIPRRARPPRAGGTPGEIGRAAIRRAVARANVPGMPTHLLDFDPADLLDIPGNSNEPRDPGGDRR